MGLHGIMMFNRGLINCVDFILSTIECGVYITSYRIGFFPVFRFYGLTFQLCEIDLGLLFIVGYLDETGSEPGLFEGFRDHQSDVLAIEINLRSLQQRASADAAVYF